MCVSERGTPVAGRHVRYRSSCNLLCLSEKRIHRMAWVRLKGTRIVIRWIRRFSCAPVHMTSSLTCTCHLGIIVLHNAWCYSRRALLELLFSATANQIRAVRWCSGDFWSLTGDIDLIDVFKTFLQLLSKICWCANFRCLREKVAAFYCLGMGITYLNRLQV